MNIKRHLIAAILFVLSGIQAVFADTNSTDVLIYTRWQYVKNQNTGEVVAKGAYHHTSTEQGAEEVRRYFTANGLRCIVTDNPEVFTSNAMKSLKLVFLCNCNHELFATDAQRDAFYRFVENGGGVVATHSSSACERGSKRFRDFLGGAFERHYRTQQQVPFANTDRSHPAMSCIPKDYVWEKDEVYLNHPDEKRIRPLLILNWKDVIPKSQAEDKYGCPKAGGHILEWCKRYGKGRVFYTALGHNAKDWSKMEWQLHLLEAARWAMGERPDKINEANTLPLARTTIDGVECVKDGKTVWKFNIANREAKPFIHPLCLPDGRCVTDARPADHPWHLGLWFCWKYINGVNYWEPRSPAQSNLFPDGMTVVKDFSIVPSLNGACEVRLSMWYGPRKEPGKVLLEEERTVSFSAPNEKGAYSIRSRHVFTARENLKLDARRPVAYGGFSLRMSTMMRDFSMQGVGGVPSSEKNIAANKEMTAVRYVDPASKHGVEVRMLAPLATERIYTWCDHRFANPMPIYEKPLELAPGESISLEYEVLVF